MQENKADRLDRIRNEISSLESQLKQKDKKKIITRHRKHDKDKENSQDD